jgi:crotonobetainyl-CoA:carnitine CoA-transferase CaiB-like acyl-CoA transferase
MPLGIRANIVFHWICETGRVKLIKRLVSSADLVIQNLAPGVMKRFGLE